jgi:hypothetical protein
LQGSKWDTFGQLDFSSCPCPNCDGGVASRVIQACTAAQFPYPTGSSGRPSAVFNENEVLYNFAIVGSSLRMYYSDEHAMSLGIEKVVLADGSSKTYTVEPFDQVYVHYRDLSFAE